MRKSILNIVFCLILFVLLYPNQVFSVENIRVLIVDGKKFKFPNKGEKVTKLGNSKGEALLEGIKYKGNIEVWKGEKGLYLINEIPFEEYIKGVVAGEMGSNWEIEALKAQSVAARTYALFQIKYGPAQKPIKFHVSSSVMHQVYKSGNVPESISRAVDETKGEIITFEGKPIIAYYHSTSGGKTEEASEVFSKSYPYLIPIETSSELSPYHVWERKIPLQEIENAIQIKGIKDIAIDSFTASNRVKNFRLQRENNESLFAAKDLRRLLGWDRLPSTLITNIVKEDDALVIEGRGYGHGVGMCQWTALDLAKKGMNYKEILSFFYPGTTIELYEKD
ncbi:MAG: SpoIID/LytB domain-containing protein [Thermodesulfovibrionales bacterium]|nr:SpoIID/LytB domain-containing protein [Thermodesulfovibrionales bacterium]